MSMIHQTRVRWVVRRSLIALTLVTCGGVMLSAQAAEDRVLSPMLATAMKRDLKVSDAQLAQYFRAERIAYTRDGMVRERLGANFAGSWIERDRDGGFRYVAATSGRAPALNGVDVRRHRYSLRELQTAAASLDDVYARSADRRRLVAVQAWHVDVPNNRVVVTVGRGGLAAAVDFVARSTADAEAVRFLISEDMSPSLLADVIGGNEYTSGGGICSIGFAVTKGGTKDFATAGHCGGPGTVVRIGNATVGSVQAQNYPGGDMAWANVRSTDVLFAAVNRYSSGTTQTVLGSTEAAIGAALCRSGRTTGWRCGTITAKNVTVNYGNGNVRGLTQSNACAGRGDSGGSWITGSGQAQGTTSGGQLPANQNTNCNEAAPITWFQPSNPLLSKFKLTLFR
ncbi:MAG: S1 family peptidase [Lysobacteraceae bacterium]|nr:MAG: S1 family peptidase [Xanthomonadaceae bacterium]